MFIKLLAKVHHRRGGGRLNESQDGEVCCETMSSSRHDMDSLRITSQHLYISAKDQTNQNTSIEE